MAECRAQGVDLERFFCYFEGFLSEFGVVAFQGQYSADASLRAKFAYRGLPSVRP